MTHLFIMCAGSPQQKLVLRAIGATHPFFNEHCLVCNQPVQYDVEATGTATVRLLVLSPAALTEFFMSTKVSAPSSPLPQRCNRVRLGLLPNHHRTLHNCLSLALQPLSVASACVCQ